MPRCHHCRKPVEFEHPLSRTAECAECGRDLHVCLNCRLFDEKAHNQCSEPLADWVVRKETANFCDYFVFADAPAAGAKGPASEAARRRLDDLFKKSG